MYSRLLFAGLLTITQVDAFATWSIIIVDPKTKEIGIAGASCSKNCFGIGAIIPDKGAIIVQAMSNKEARSKGIAMIQADAGADEIISALRDAYYDPENQQYAVVLLNDFDHPSTYTGKNTAISHGSLKESCISVQGNILANDEVLVMAMEAAKRGKAASMSIDQILMAALEAGAVAGGDKRCGEQKATSAFIAISRPDDRKPYLELVIFGQKQGGPNAVEMLSRKYHKWASRRDR